MTAAEKTITASVLQEHELPQALRPAREDLLDALRKPVLGSWPEDESFHDAPQPEAIGEVLLEELHGHLVNARIGYLFRETLTQGGAAKAAIASKVGGKLAYFAELDFLVEVNWTAWRDLTPAQRVALIDHEICHFGVEDTESGETKHVILPHDVEEFSAIVQRWGLWQPELVTFGKAVTKQMSLFEGAAEAERPESVDGSLKHLAEEEAKRTEKQISVEDGGKARQRGRKKGKKK